MDNIIAISKSERENTNMENSVDCIRKDELLKQIEHTINYRGAKAKRLLKNESFIQHVNILYSCFGAFLSVWSLLIDHKIISFIATIVSIILVLSITYLNSQRYAARAKDLDANILDLQNLQTELLADLTNEELLKEWKIYNSFLAASEREDEYDKLYYDFFEYLPSKSQKSKGSYLKNIQFYIMATPRLLLKGIILILPFVITAFLIHSVIDGTISCMDSLCQKSVNNENHIEESYENFQKPYDY